MVCAPPRGPHFVKNVGIQEARELDNTSIKLVWREAIPSNHLSEIFYNIYISSNRFDVISSGPKFATSGTSVTLKKLTPGLGYHFAVRAVEVEPDQTGTYTDLAQVGVDLYEYPSTILTADLDAYQTVLLVDDAVGFPAGGGLAIIGDSSSGTFNELIRYNSTTTFPLPDQIIILNPSVNRGLEDTDDTFHSAGTTVRVSFGVEDTNTVILHANSEWSQPNFPRTEVGPSNTAQVGLDGYREPADIVTSSTFGNTAEAANIDFLSYDYRTYQRTRPQELFSGGCIPSYIGGVENGYRGLNLSDQISGRLEVLLEQSGEPTYILSRKFTGKQCRCKDSRRDHHKARCTICFGTGFVQGYEQFFNPRREDGAVMARFSKQNEGLKSTDKHGLLQNYDPSAWIANTPVVRNRDVLVRFDEDGHYEFRYEIQQVSRNRRFYSKPSRQVMMLKRLDKTDPIYQFPLRHTRGTGPDNHPINNDDQLQSFVLKPAGLFPHMHTISITGPILNVTEITGFTSQTFGQSLHTHSVSGGVVQPSDLDGHTHDIRL